MVDSWGFRFQYMEWRRKKRHLGRFCELIEQVVWLHKLIYLLNWCGNISSFMFFLFGLNSVTIDLMWKFGRLDNFIQLVFGSILPCFSVFEMHNKYSKEKPLTISYRLCSFQSHHKNAFTFVLKQNKRSAILFLCHQDLLLITWLHYLGEHIKMLNAAIELYVQKVFECMNRVVYSIQLIKLIK